METPLIQLGPSQSYGTAYFGSGNRIIAVEAGSVDVQPPPYRNATDRTFLDRLFKIDRVYFSPAAAAADVLTQVTNQETPKRKPRKQKLTSLLTQLHRNAENVLCIVNQLTLFARATLQEKDHDDEPHPQTTRSTRTHSTVPKRSWLLPNDARTRRAHRSEQSHSLRTCRSTYSQRGFNKRSEQGALFIDC